MAHGDENSSLGLQTNTLDGALLGKKPIKKTSHPIGNSSATYQRRASVGSSFNGDSSRRDASVKFITPNNRETVIPHYLRASTGSCHDFCKYGKNHTSEVKPWHSFPKRVAKTPSTKLCSKENSISVESNQVTEVKHRPPRGTRTHAEDLNPSPDSKTISQYFSKSIKNEVSLPPKEVKLTPDKLETETELKTSNMPLRHAPLLQPKAVLVKVSPSSKTSEGKHNKGKIDSEIKDGKLPQASYPSLSSYDSQGELRRSRKHSDVMGRKTVTESVSYQREVQRPSDNLPSSMVSINKIRHLTSRKNSNSKVVPLIDQNEIQNSVNVKQPKNEKISVKTLCSSEKGTVRNIAKPIRNRGVAASSHNHDQIEEDTIACNHGDWEKEEGEGERNVETGGGLDDAETEQIRTNKDASEGTRKEGVESKVNRTLTKGTTSPKDKNSSPLKLNFRRGKVVQLHSDHNTPIRLKFRCGRILLGNKDGMASVKKICMKKGVVDDKDVADPSSKKVVLRHQDVQDKKNGPGLLNNVIEEAASKLIESKKSKVRALVGAFETVISLQES
ncbi:hypothetical protein Leryth_026914 [Lithospermum erythrorhizon]|nr:hypothetical protein Leryth_026914 [Lithospermum erythrorhizon]